MLWLKFFHVGDKDPQLSIECIQSNYTEYGLRGLMNPARTELSGQNRVRILWDTLSHDNVIKWKHFRGNWPFVRRIHRSPVNSPHSLDVFFDLRLNKWLSKQSWGWWFETLSCPLWRHCNVHCILIWPLPCVQGANIKRLWTPQNVMTLSSRCC